jgi:peptide-methionine (S)-S-oxide reductase
LEKATFAAGCFWGVEAEFRNIDGVTATAVGYTGGHTSEPTYRDVCNHTTGHAEAVRVEFDPAKISYEKLLDEFWKLHDPTQLNRQGPDVGDQYRSAVFFHGLEQEEIAKRSRDAAQAHVRHPIVTEITPADMFWPAEEYHQRYFEKNGISSCRIPNMGTAAVGAEAEQLG